MSAQRSPPTRRREDEMEASQPGRRERSLRAPQKVSCRHPGVHELRDNCVTRTVLSTGERLARSAWEDRVLGRAK